MLFSFEALRDLTALNPVLAPEPESEVLFSYLFKRKVHKTTNRKLQNCEEPGESRPHLGTPLELHQVLPELVVLVLVAPTGDSNPGGTPKRRLQVSTFLPVARSGRQGRPPK